MKITVTNPADLLAAPTTEKAAVILLTAGAKAGDPNLIVSTTPIVPGTPQTYDVAPGQMLTVEVYVDAP